MSLIVDEKRRVIGLSITDIIFTPINKIKELLEIEENNERRNNELFRLPRGTRTP